MPSRAEQLEAAAARLSFEAGGLGLVVSTIVQPALAQLPTMWVGPAADRLAGELALNRHRLLDAAAELRQLSARLRREALAIRAADAAAGVEEVVAGVV